MSVLYRKLFTWLASRCDDSLRVPYTDLIALCKDFDLNVTANKWSRAVGDVAPHCHAHDSVELLAVRHVLAIASIFVPDDQWQSLVHRVRDAHIIHIDDGPSDVFVDPAAAQIVLAHPAGPHTHPQPAAYQIVPRITGTKRRYEELSHAELIDRLRMSDRRVKKMQSNIRVAKSRVRKKHQQNLAMVVAMKAERCNVLCVPAHIHNHKLSVDKMLAVALRRNMSSIGSHNYGLVVGEDISRQSVCKAETFAALQLNNHSGWAVTDMLSALCVPGQRGVFCLSYVCDATNSSIWQQRKLHSLIAEVRVSSGSAGCRNRSVLKQAADVLPVEDGSAMGAEVFACWFEFVLACVYASCIRLFVRDICLFGSIQATQ